MKKIFKKIFFETPLAVYRAEYYALTSILHRFATLTLTLSVLGFTFSVIFATSTNLLSVFLFTGAVSLFFHISYGLTLLRLSPIFLILLFFLLLKLPVLGLLLLYFWYRLAFVIFDRFN
jgi:hypothetical protein